MFILSLLVVILHVICYVIYYIIIVFCVTHMDYSITYYLSLSICL